MDPTTYDPLTGSALPTLTRDDAPVSGPYTGDTGYNYGQEVFDLLKQGASTLITAAGTHFENKQSVQLGGSKGITHTGQAVGSGVAVGGVSVSMPMLLLGAAVVGLAIYLHGKR